MRQVLVDQGQLITEDDGIIAPAPVVTVSLIAKGVFLGMTAFTIIGGIVFAAIWFAIAH